ncbi:UNVERIFIED_CONTAM: hypothetical protein GTU68_028218 [Idotea baltica]|nr:hypothetical protein [Idotea baltica]
MQHPLPKSYYQSSNVLALARDLLGKTIVTQFEGSRTSARIVETEAYRAPEDRGSHAFGNKRTPRTETMFEEGGIAYIYLCYGMHHLCNVVTGPQESAHAVLIRAVEPIDGIEVMSDRNGPGKWTSAMGITTLYNGVNYWEENSPIRIYEGESIDSDNIVAGPRVGIKYAQAWAHIPWRYTIRDSPYVSKPEIVKYDQTLIYS